MSKATKRKHVRKELLSQDYSVPEDLSLLVKIVRNQGNNLHEIETHEGETYFVSMPGKFRNNIWIKPGDFVIVKPIEEGNKVKAEIEQILDKKYIQFLKQENSWPFKQDEEISAPTVDDMSDEDIGGGNLNRRNNVEAGPSDTSESDQSE